MKKSLSHWLTRDLTIFGRVILFKAEGISKLIYPCHSLFVSSNNIRKVNSVIFQFIWRNKTHYIKRSQLVKEYDKGGVKALDFESMVGTFRINWIKAYLSQPNSMWFHVPRSLFHKIGGLDFLLKCDFEVSKIPIKLSSFHRQILQFWKMIFTHNFSPHSSTLWNNRVILINRKSIFKNDWVERDIMFVTDLLDCNGNILDYKTFVDKYNFNCCHREFKKVCKAIPIPLIQLIKSVLMYANVKAVLPNLVIEECNLYDRKCNNTLISTVLKSRVFHDYYRGVHIQVSESITLSITDKAFSKYIKWPVSPKVKETHFKIINKMYPTAAFLSKRFRFEVDPCTFCGENEETLEHMFLLCPLSQRFWSTIRNWLLLKITDIPTFDISHILFYMDNLNTSVSDMINIILLLGKYHLHCSKWRNSKPSFNWFLNDFKLFFLSLKKMHSSRIAKKISIDFSNLLLF